MRIDDLLGKYESVGLDLDETLINSVNSPMLWNYIKENKFNQKFFIVTFRSGELVELILPDLYNSGSSLTEDHFEEIFTCPHEIWRNHYLMGNNKLVATLADIPDDPYVVWKGMICSQNNIPVLIDDMTHTVSRGCRKYGIVHYHPDDLN